MKAISAVTSGKACCWAAATVSIIWIFRGRFTRGAIIFFGTGLSSLLVELLKGIFQRARPPFSNMYDSYSFPSGHVLTSTVFFSLIVWSLSLDVPARRKRLAGIATVMIALVGCSRIYLGAHWPSDVVGGFLIGYLFMKVWLRLTTGSR